LLGTDFSNASRQLFEDEKMTSKKPEGLRPGTPAPVSGQYQKIGPRGGQGTEITAGQGKPLPPADGPGGSFRLVDPTKHKK
jgi:hypothetical protein